MKFSDIIGQDRVVHAIQRALESGRVAHAYVFFGPEGVGKRATALALAQVLQCEQVANGNACGECGACHKSEKGVHPDTQVLMPMTKDAAVEDIVAMREKLFQDPYQRVGFQHGSAAGGVFASSNKQVFLSQDNLNENLRRPMSFHRAEGRHRVGVLLDVELMRTDAANAFLKLLEEPGDSTVFILVTSRIDHLLPTILSRCQQMRFDALPDDVIEGAMLSRSVEAASASMLARMADGSIARAIELSANQELLETRERVLEYLRLSYQGKGDVVVAAVEAMSRQGREGVKFQLQVMLSLLRDLLLIQTTGNTDQIVNIDKAETLIKFSANLPDAKLESMIDAVEETAYLAERNVNLKLALIALSRTFSSAMRGDASASIKTDILEVGA